MPITITLLVTKIRTRTMITETEITIIGATTTIAINAEVIAGAITVVIGIGGAITPLRDEKIKISIGIKGLEEILA